MKESATCKDLAVDGLPAKISNPESIEFKGMKKLILSAPTSFGIGAPAVSFKLLEVPMPRDDDSAAVAHGLKVEQVMSLDSIMMTNRSYVSGPTAVRNVFVLYTCTRCFF